MKGTCMYLDWYKQTHKQVKIKSTTICTLVLASLPHIKSVGDSYSTVVPTQQKQQKRFTGGGVVNFGVTNNYHNFITLETKLQQKFPQSIPIYKS